LNLNLVVEHELNKSAHLEPTRIETRYIIDSSLLVTGRPPIKSYEREIMNKQHTNPQTIFRALLCLSMISCAAATMASGTGNITAAAQRLIQEENKEFSKYQDAVQQIHRNASTFESKNYDAYMDTLSADCEGRSLTADVIKQMNAMDLDLQIDIVSFDILPDGTDSKVKIDCVQTTKKVGGKARFVDNEMHSIHTVVKTEDGWKIQKSKILTIHMLHDNK